MKNPRILIFSIIIGVCILAIAVTIYMQSIENDYNQAIKNSDGKAEISEDDATMIKNNFDNIFKNDITGNADGVSFKYGDKELVYTSAEAVKLIPNKYDLDVQIPQININNIEIDRCNNEIKKLFQNKAASILGECKEYTVYDVKYKAYINNGILSLIIRANLKEGTKSERKIIKTYNYDLGENKLLEIQDIMQKQNLGRNELQEKISAEIQKQINYEKGITDMGYEVYSRDINNEMYQVENVNNFILGENGFLYIIYAYGNNNYTSETDLVII